MWLPHDYDLANLWFWDNIQILELALCLKNMDHMKEILSTKSFHFYFLMISENFIQFGILGTDIQNFDEEILILYILIHSKSMTNMKIKLLMINIKRNSLFFFFILICQIFWKSICWRKICHIFFPFSCRKHTYGSIFKWGYDFY